MSKSPGEDVLRVYEMADRVSMRRGAANQFYLALETLLLGVPAGFASFGPAIAKPLPISAVFLVGAVVSVLWLLQLRAYRDLNREKFVVIQTIEKEHLRVRPFTDEWVPLDDRKRRWRERYLQLGTLERLVPVVFLVADVCAGVIVWL